MTKINKMTRALLANSPNAPLSLGGSVDAATVTYTPAVLTNWDSDTDPGNVDAALDQLSERVSALEIKQVIFTVEGVIAVASGVLRVPNHTGHTLTLAKAYLDCTTAPTGSALIADIHKSGTTIFTNQSHRPQITASGYAGNTELIDVPNWANNEYLTVDIDQVGSVVAGSNLTVTITYT